TKRSDNRLSRRRPMYGSQSSIEAWRSEGRAEGRAEGMILGMLEARRADLLRALLLRFQAPPPADLAAAARALEDLNCLTHWLDAALTAASLDMFRTIVAGTDLGSWPTAAPKW